MAILAGMITIIPVIVLILIISALPLYFAIKMLRGEVTIAKAIGITLLSGFISLAIESFFKFGGLFVWIVLLFLYKAAFKVSLGKAFIAWILQMVIVGVLYVLAATILGLSFLSIGL